ncbi:flagellar protein FlaG [Thiomicrorhabdus heinhorstiae]|uniref:Flagellar protein FlaG n=1 Tax=Thiomicrorhabdus heinhorstiae TaxID=2748010 RepID=A0ABS0BYC2_9GAMM|nr:flagellar protein FlaG [Thiomicrorhabdus heinhorstiae]MBF6058389.1 flagellar protein FlaG [Thiomicrorhabdus heinhorstiae]
MDINGFPPMTNSAMSQVGNEVNNQVAKPSVLADKPEPEVSEIKEPVTIGRLGKEAEKLNELLGKMGHSLSFKVDADTQSSVVEVIDSGTQEVIRQLPTEDSLKIMKNIQDYLNAVQQRGGDSNESITGVLLDKIV